MYDADETASRIREASRLDVLGFLQPEGINLRHTEALPKTSLDEALARFRGIYPTFNSSSGNSGFIAAHWEEYACLAKPDEDRKSEIGGDG